MFFYFAFLGLFVILFYTEAKMEFDEISEPYLPFPEARSLDVQCHILSEAFSLSGGYDARARKGRYDSRDADGQYIIPRYGRLAPSYFQAVREALSVLAGCRQGLVLDGDMCGFWRRSARTRAAMSFIDADTRSDADCLVVAASTGSPFSFKVGEEMFKKPLGFYFGILEIAYILISHPPKLTSDEDRGYLCSADVLTNENGVWVPCFCFRNGVLVLSLVPYMEFNYMALPTIGYLSSAP